MRTAILVALLIGAAPVSASFRPTPEQEDEIKSHIVRGRAAARALREDKDVLAAMSLKRSLEAQMGMPEDADRAPTEAELDRINGFWRDRRGEYQRAAKAVNDLKRERDSNLNHAVSLTQKYYRINPGRSSGVVRHNADSPNLGKTWNWSHRFAPEAEAGELEDVDVWISPDSGVVNFREGAFSSPAMLAFKIAHEEYHYYLALADEEYWLLKFEEEVHINKTALRHVSDFGLSTDEVRFILRNTAGMYAIALEERRRMDQGQSPKTPHGGFGLKPSPSEYSELLSQIDADLTAFDRVLAVGVTDERLEEVKAGAQSEFVRDLNRDDLVKVIYSWRDARENDANQPGRESQMLRERRERQLRESRSRILEAAAACGFQATADGDFYSQGVPVFRVYHGGDIDRAKAAFLLIDACLGEGHDAYRPCNDAIEFVATHWQEPKFKDAMMMWRVEFPAFDATSAEGKCLLDLHDSWTPRGDSADLKSTIETNYKRRLAGRPKPPAPQTPRQPRPPRESPTPPGGRGQCFWTNDGREICP